MESSRPQSETLGDAVINIVHQRRRSDEATPLIARRTYGADTKSTAADPRNIYDLPPQFPPYSLDDEKVERVQTHDLNFLRANIRGIVCLWLLCLFLLTRPDRYLRRCENPLDRLPNPFHREPVPHTIEERVRKILTTTPLIDGHNDLAILIRVLYNNHIYHDNFTVPFTEGGMAGHVDLPRLAAGGNGGAFWSAFVPCPANGSDLSKENYADSVAFTYDQIDLINRLRAAYPDTFSPLVNSSTAMGAFRAHQLISPIGIEGLHQIGNTLSNLRNMYTLGVRYATLTHNCHNIYADAALVETTGGGVEVATPLWGGVSAAGRELIHEMNRLGMLVDLAHVSADTMRDVLGGRPEKWAGSAAPIIFSHSSAYAVCPHPRNVPDDVLALVQQTGSVVMVNFSPGFISCTARADGGVPDFYPANATLAQVVRHITYIGELIGYDHVGLGSDFDGIPTTPEGLDDVSQYPQLVAALLRAGVSDVDVAKVVGGNVLRVWAAADAVALQLQADEVPAEDAYPDMKFLLKDW